ncbi:MAG: hypothetical protein L0H75_08340 [Nitrosospira sp.]|nr:hypothetical protein [Nitrosospira sp.]
MTMIASTKNHESVNAATVASAQTQDLMKSMQNRFLTLLVTQMQNQNPLNPMSNAQVTSQIAQMSTAKGIKQLNNTLLALSGQMDISQSLQAANLIGKTVLVPGTKISLGSDPNNPMAKEATSFGVDLMSASTKTVVSILDPSGLLIRKLELGPQPAGVLTLSWDGLDESGAPAPDGGYRVQVSASDAQGQPVSVQALTSGTVSSVAYSSEGPNLNLGLAGAYPLSDVREVM